MRTRTTLAAVLLATALPWSVAAPARAEEPPCTVDLVPTSDRQRDTRVEVDPVHERLHVPAAQEIARGRGVKVAVIDSGVAPVGGLRPVPLFRAPGVSPLILSGHGTIAASQIAGDRGVAPEAQVYDVRVFDRDGADASQGEKPVTSGAIAAGVRAVIARHAAERFDIVNISLSVRENDAELERAIADLVALDVVVVAAAGNRRDDTAGTKGTPDSDADVYPADYPGVLAVTAAAPEGAAPAEFVVPNRDTDVAAPVLGGVAVNANGQVCVLPDVATSWAAAQVSGVLALLRERFPRDNAAQLVARLLATTEGVGDVDGVRRDPWTGAGVVQAYDALTRELEPGRRGTVDGAVPSTRNAAQAP
ncbi:MAG: S8/S53 family peptidase, partial [Nocardioides sp.]|nr:S8/S53 family peptidase [Nocardioides sp.]